MTDFVIYADEEEFSRAQAEILERAIKGFVQTELPLAVEFAFVDETEIRRLNRELRQTDKVTDVLSFPAFDGVKDKPFKKKDYLWELDENGNLLIGSIAVCIERAKEQAEEYGHSFERELNYLLVHGILHCLGYDHMTDEEKAEMRKKEEFVLKKAGITRE
ncbi:MAG: rRNA maturation RNase YbeY [Clostridia bacterium]|nr:rRNA maturation RNase YbeY [Clostridia bacterium]